MEIKRIDAEFSVCKVEEYSLSDLDHEYCFTGKTDDENPLSVLQRMFRKIRQNVMTDGKHSAFRACWISL